MGLSCWYYAKMFTRGLGCLYCQVDLNGAKGNWGKGRVEVGCVDCEFYDWDCCWFYDFYVGYPWVVGKVVLQILEEATDSIGYIFEIAPTLFQNALPNSNIHITVPRRQPNTNTAINFNLYPNHHQYLFKPLIGKYPIIIVCIGCLI